LWIILGSRVLAGICGANITVAQAYIADITPPDQRSKRMGLIGAAFGLGFIFGPAIGGVAMHGIKSLGWEGFGPSGPGWVAAALCATNLLLAFVRLKESRQPGAAHTGERPRVAQWLHVLRRPAVGMLIGVFFLATLCFTCYETTLGLIIMHNFGLDRLKDATTVTTLFVYCGLIGAYVQGGMIGRLVKRFGEPKLIAASMVILGLGLGMIPFIHGDAGLSWGVLFRREGLPWLAMLFALGWLSLGAGLTRPPLFGMLSKLTSADEQGETLGVAQSAGSLARIPGPLFATAFFDAHPAWPYLACAVLAVATGLIAWTRLTHPAPAAVPTRTAGQPS
jgi:MFS family permease